MAIGILGVVILSISLLFYRKIAINGIPREQGEVRLNDAELYDKRIKSFVAMETMALEIYKLPRNTAKAKLLYEINDRGIYYWNENIKLLKELDQLNLPNNIHERDKLLIHYCSLRIKSYNFVYKMVNEDTEKYKDSITVYDKQIKAIIDGLKAK